VHRAPGEAASGVRAGQQARLGRYALIGQPETLIILQRMETNPFGLRGQWEKELEDLLPDDLEFAWGPRIRLSR
jgi:hypothetical protein